jgi:hypothetical protein
LEQGVSWGRTGADAIRHGIRGAALGGMSVSAAELRPRGAMPRSLRAAIAARLRELVPGATLERLAPFGIDTKKDGSSVKAMGYGQPLLAVARDPRGLVHTFVFHTATPNEFGHDRRADRAADMVLAYDTFPLVPRHTRAIDVGALGRDGRLVSLRDASEFYLLTSYAEGRPYAEDLREIARRGEAFRRDMQRVELLAGYLAGLHRPIDAPAAYVRSIRDLVGSGEGIFGIADAYPHDDPALSERLARIEAAAVAWRWDLRRRTNRASRIHGDFHPFNVLFDERGALSLLDASRGCLGDPADDVAALAVNFVFFGLQSPEAWPRGFRSLWRGFFGRYRALRGDHALLEVLPPFFAWRLLVVACPRWYPALAPRVREQLLRLAEEVLAEPRLELEGVEALFT